MDAKIAVVGYKDFNDYFKSLIDHVDRNVLFDFYNCSLDQCFGVVSELENNGTDIIITGRTYKMLLENKTHLPVIAFHITSIDVLSAIKKSIFLTRHIAIALGNFENLEYDYTILQDLLDIELHFISYGTELELKTKIEQFAKTKGVVIGTSIAAHFAKEYGLNSILIYSFKNSILGSIDRALEIIDFKRQEEQQNKKFKAIIHSVSDGIIATNDRNEITMINDSMCNLLQTPKNNVLGKDLSVILPPNSTKELATFADDTQDKIIKIGPSTLNTTQTPIKVKGKKVGNVLTFQDITKIQKIEQKYRLENEAKGLMAKNHFVDIIYSSEIMKHSVERAKKFAKTDSTILIIGETGTGKEILAQSIHNYSPRKSSPFVAINCAALPETLLESELFGYEDGAFTGAAKKGKKGLFELAHNGTVFLDEINSISLHFQARLLRVLQEKEIVRVGGNRVIPIDVRIIAATNQDLMNLVVSNHFRADLFYRLNLLKVTLPPLRQRLEDIIPLARHFISERNPHLYHEVGPFFDRLFTEMLRHHFPGNVRELFNILERFIILWDPNQKNGSEYYQRLLSECIDIYPGLIPSTQKVEFDLKDNYKESLMEAERSLMGKYMKLYNGDKTFIAEKLGMGRTTLYRKLKELHLE
jgi:transcriptional regulator, propionate catabolism operon regulatory protein